jgi:transcriptional regulator with XRE-family HTH domain
MWWRYGMDTNGIGRRIAYWRERRRMTQADFGALLGKSRRWVQDLEGGQRQADPRLSVLEGAARILAVPIETLLTDASTNSDVQCIDARGAASIREMLSRHDVITGTCDDDGDAPIPMDALQRRVEYSWTAFQASHFAALGRFVPDLIADANRAAARHEGDARLASFRLLSMALQLAEGLATKFGDAPLAYSAADRAVIAAERSEDPIMMASAARHLADAMIGSGRPRDAASFAIAAAARLEGLLVDKGAAGLSVLGMLYLKAGMATATADDARSASGYFDEADDAATRLGSDGNALWTAFGPTNVALYRVSANVRLFDGAAALTAAGGVSQVRQDALPRERRAHYLIDLAHAYSQSNQRGQAVDTLLLAEGLAPEEVRCRPHAIDLVDNLRLLGAGTAEGRLQTLAQRCGLPT